MSDDSIHKLLFLALLIISISLFLNVGTYGVTESSDARYAEISRSMSQNNDYIHPDFLNIHHYHKPPFTYQITALGIKIFGVNAFATRFFLQISIILQTFLVYSLSKILFGNKKTALWSALIYSSFPIVLIASRNLTTDAFLTTFVLSAIYFWVKYRKTGFFLYLHLTTLSFAFGFFTKGPVVFIVPLVFILIYNSIEKSKSKWSFHHFLAWSIFLITAGWWFVYLGYENQEFVNYFLGNQTVDRFSKNAFDRSEPFWYFLILSPLMSLPWLFVFFIDTKNLIKLWNIKKMETLLIFSFLIPLIFFSISSSKRILYILPLYGILAIFIAQKFQFLNIQQTKKIFKFVYGFLIVLLLSIVAFKFIQTVWIIPNTIVIFSFLSFILSILIYYILKIELKSKTILISALTTTYLLLAGSTIMSYNMLAINATNPITDFLKNNKLDNRNILIYNSLKPSFAFNLNKPIISLFDGNNGLKRETQFETNVDWNKYWIDLQNLENDRKLYLNTLLSSQSIIIAYKEPIPENRNWLVDNLKKEIKIGKYFIYY